MRLGLEIGTRDLAGESFEHARSSSNKPESDSELCASVRPKVDGHIGARNGQPVYLPK